MPKTDSRTRGPRALLGILEPAVNRGTFLWYRLTARRPSKTFTEWLRAHGIADSTIDILGAFAIPWPVVIVSVRFESERSIMEWNDEEQPSALAVGLLVIGSGPSGDAVAVDVREQIGAVGYISHELMSQQPDQRRIFRLVSPSIWQFAAAMARREAPYDYAEAQNCVHPKSA